MAPRMIGSRLCYMYFLSRLRCAHDLQRVHWNPNRNVRCENSVNRQIKVSKLSERVVFTHLYRDWRSVMTSTSIYLSATDGFNS